MSYEQINILLLVTPSKEKNHILESAEISRKRERGEVGDGEIMGRGRQIDKRETEREEKLPLLKCGRLRLNDLLNNFTSVIHAYKQRNL